jgi:thiol-disulfide isomerase/thioredoxin
VDRYGAQPIHPAYMVTEPEFSAQILESAKPAAVELFNNETIQCLLHSIPIKDLFEGGANVKYRKMEVKDDSLLKKYGVSKLPALLFFNDGKLVGKIEGFFEDKEISKMKKKIRKILPKLKQPLGP